MRKVPWNAEPKDAMISGLGGWGGAGVTAETEGRKPSASVVIEKGPSSDRG